MSKPVVRNAMLAACAGLAACAAPAPVDFSLVGPDNDKHVGTFQPANQAVEVWIGDIRYQGFYILSTSVETVLMPPTRFMRFPRDSTVVSRSNTARAHLVGSDGAHLNCEFLFEGNRAIGECRSPGGRVYQLVAGAAD